MAVKNWCLTKEHRARALVLFALLGLSACHSQSDSLSPATNNQVSPTELVIDGSSVLVAVPAQLRTINEVNPQAVQAIVTVNGVESELQRGANGQFSGQINVPAQSGFNVRIDFYEAYSGQRLTLARAEKMITTASDNLSLLLQPGDYDYNSFDFDGDNVSNIVERQYNTSPLDSEQRPELVEVEVLAAPAAAAVSAGFNEYLIEATVGSKSFTVAANTGQLSHVFEVVKQDTLTANVRLIESRTGQSVTIGTQTRQIVNPQAYSQVIFDGAQYDLFQDQDNDGFSNLDELIAGTDLFAAPVANQINYLITFEVPAEITNPSNAFAMLQVNGNNVNLSRVGNTYIATTTATAGAQVNIEVQVNDNYQGQVVTLATFSGDAVPTEGETLTLQGFSNLLDADNDGILNFAELAQGSNPFAAETPACTPVTENIFATLTDDAYLQNNNIFNNNRLNVEEDERTTMIRYQYDASLGSVIGANFSITVGSDQGDGVLSFYVVPGFEWNDNDSSLSLPNLGVPISSVDGDWDEDNRYAFGLNPEAITSDFTLFVTLENGNDVSFKSSVTSEPPTLEVALERCE